MDRTLELDRVCHGKYQSDVGPSGRGVRFSQRLRDGVCNAGIEKVVFLTISAPARACTNWSIL